MGHTKNKWTQDTAVNDGQIFVGISNFIDISGNSTITSTGTGDLGFSMAASKACTFYCNLNLLLRQNPVATPASSQRQFGTAAGVPGPSAVANTSDPLALPPGFPPLTAAQLATVSGYTGPAIKGTQINFIDVVYMVNAVNLASASIGLTSTMYLPNVPPVITTDLPLANNGIVYGFQANPHKPRIIVTNPTFAMGGGYQRILNINFTTPAGGTAKFYGCILGVSYNWS